MLSHRPKQSEYFRRGLESLLLVVAFFVSFHLRKYADLPFVDPEKSPNFSSHSWFIVLAIPLFWLISRSIQRRSTTGLLRQVTATFAWFGLALATSIFLFQARTFSRSVFFLFLAFSFAAVCGSRYLQRRIAASRLRTPNQWRNVLIVGNNPEARTFGTAIDGNPELGLRVIGYVLGPNEEPRVADNAVLGPVDHLRRLIDKHVVDDVVFAIPQSSFSQLAKYVAWCEEIGVTVHLKMDFLRTIVAKSLPNDLDGTPLLTLTTVPTDAVALTVKRLIDSAVSSIALIALSPLLLLVVIAVRLTSKGPAIFSQQRVGLNGRIFTFYKFRSMRIDAERNKKEVASLNEMTGPVFKARRDPRVTRLGRWLRKFSLDELPQLWNVLSGDMSLVGPRPPLPSEVSEYERWQVRRLSMKPGITCLWQVAGRNDVPFETWMRLDLEYIDNWSLGLDLKILLRTLPAVILARGSR